MPAGARGSLPRTARTGSTTPSYRHRDDAAGTGRISFRHAVALPARRAHPVTELHGNWTADWAWSLPIVLLTVLGHSFGLLLVQDRVVPVLARGAHRFRRRFGLVISGTMLLVITLHAIEAGAWAGAYVGLGVLPDVKSAFLFSVIQGVSLPPRRDRSRRPPHGGPASSASDRQLPARATEDSSETRD